MIASETRYFINDNPRGVGVKQLSKDISWNLMSLIYKVYLTAISPKIVDKKYNVSICAVFKNEAMYLREWIEFNHLVGVEHFYLYNNNSDDDYVSVLKPYVKNGMVTLLDCHTIKSKWNAMKSALKNFLVRQSG